MEKLTKLIFLLTIIICEELKCSQSKDIKCTEPIKINFENELTPTVSMQEIKAIVRMYQGYVKGYLYTRSYWKSYCYNGGAWDKNSYCVSSKNELNPDEEELMDWIKNKKCKIGPICRVDGPCWGSDAEKCNKIVVDKWVSKSEFKELGKDYRLFAYHACVLDWKCSIKEFSFKAKLIWDNGPKNTIVSPKGAFLSAKHLNMTNIDEEFAIFLEDDMSAYLEHDVNVKCFIDDSSNCFCIYENMLIGSVTFKIDLKTKTSIKENFALFLIGDLKSNDGSKTIYQRGNYLDSNLSQEDDSKTSDIYDVKQLEDIIDSNSLREEYNTQVTWIEIQRISDILTKMLISLSKTDPELIPEILRMGGKTVWETKKLFRVCENKGPVIEHNSNCHEGETTKGGVQVKISSETLCEKFPSYTNISILGHSNIDFNWSLPKIWIEKSYLDEGPWKWLAENKDNIMSMSGVKADKGTILNGESGYDYWSIAVKISVVVSFLNLVIVLCLIGRR
nr:TPA_asm: hemagglutinin [Cotesiavirus orthomyxi]